MHGFCRIHAKKVAEQRAQLHQQLQEAAKMQRENHRLENGLVGLQSSKAQEEHQQQIKNMAPGISVPAVDRKMQTLMNIRQLKDISALQVSTSFARLIAVVPDLKQHRDHIDGTWVKPARQVWARQDLCWILTGKSCVWQCECVLEARRDRVDCQSSVLLLLGVHKKVQEATSRSCPMQAHLSSEMQFALTALLPEATCDRVFVLVSRSGLMIAYMQA